MKKAISVLLSLVIAFGVLGGAGISASAASNGTCGENLTWTLDDNGTLTITGTGEMYDYLSWEDQGSIKTVVIGSGVTGIGIGAFDYCYNLTSVTIPATVTSIGYDAFYECESLTSVNIPSGVTQIAGRAFEDCYELTSVTIPDTVTSIGESAFAYCHSLTSVTISAAVQTIGEYAFSNCPNLFSVTVPDGVLSVGNYAFRGAANVIYAGVSAEGAPWGAKALNGTVDGDLVYSDGTKQVVAACRKSAEEITVPSGVTAIGDSAFKDCYELTSVTLPATVTSIGQEAFAECYSLTSVNIPSGVTQIAYGTFADCNSLTSVTLPAGVTAIGYGAFADCYSLTSVALPAGVTTIGGYAFYECYNLTSVTLPDSVTSIGERAFNMCYSRTSVKIPSGVTLIADGTFYNCFSLEDIEIPGVKEIGNDAFGFCASLDEINLPDSVQSIASSAFNYAGLRSVSFGKNLASVSPVAFFMCPLEEITCSAGNPDFKAVNGCLINPGTKTLVLGAGTAVIPDDGSVETIGYAAFCGRRNLESITIPSSVKSIGEYAFYYCDGLNELEVPSTVTPIGNDAFYEVFHVKYSGAAASDPPGWGARVFNGYAEGPLVYEDSGRTNLLACHPSATGAITIPEGVTAIADRAFYNCNKITEVNIPGSVQSIGANAFSGCYGIFSLDVPSGVTNIGNWAFGGVCNVVYNGTASSDPPGWGADNFNLYRSGDLLYSDSSMKKVVKANLRAESVVIPEGTEEIDGKAFKPYHDDFCKLKEIAIPGSVKEIADGTFAECYILEKVTLSPGLKVIGEDAFAQCYNLKEIIIPSGVTEIKDGAFAQCVNLRDVVIPLSLVTVGDGAFPDRSLPDELEYLEQRLKYEIIELKYDAAAGIDVEDRLELYNTYENMINLLKSGDYGVKDVYYEGTEAQRAGIAVGEENSTFTQATWHYGSLGPAADLAAAKESAKAAIDAAVPQGASDAVKAVANGAKQAIDGAADTAAVEAAKNKGLDDIKAQLDKEAALAAAKEAAKAEIDKAVPADASDAVKAIANGAKQAIDGAADTAAVEAAKNKGINDIKAQLDKEAGQKEEAKKTEIAIRGWQSVLKVDYRSTVTFNADVTNSAGKEIIWCDKDGKKLGTGASYTTEVRKDMTVMCKTTDADGNEVTSQVEEVKLNSSSFLTKIIAFFKSLFGTLPKYVDNKKA